MIVKKIGWAITALQMVLFFQLVASAQPQPVRVAVLNFETAGNSNYYNQNDSVHKLLTAKIEEGLQNLGSYKMVERTMIDSLQREFNLINTGVIDKETAARRGLVRGVDAIIYGSINEFAITGRREDGQYTLSDLGVILKIQVKMTSAETWSLLLTNEFSAKSPVEVQRPVENSTQSTLAVVKGVSKIWGAIKNKRITDLKVTRPDPEAEKEHCSRLISAALDSVIGDVVSKIQATKVETARHVTEIASNVKGTILSVRPNNVVFITGIKTNIVKPGDRLQVKRTSNERDPSTNKIISFDEAIGEVEIIEIQNPSVIRARFSSSSEGRPQKGDKVTN